MHWDSWVPGSIHLHSDVTCLSSLSLRHPDSMVSLSAVIIVPSHDHPRSLLSPGFLCPCALTHCYNIQLQSEHSQVGAKLFLHITSLPVSIFAHTSNMYNIKPWGWSPSLSMQFASATYTFLALTGCSSQAYFLTSSSLCLPQAPSSPLFLGSFGPVCLGSFLPLSLLNQIPSLKGEI